MKTHYLLIIIAPKLRNYAPIIFYSGIRDSVIAAIGDKFKKSSMDSHSDSSNNHLLFVVKKKKQFLNFSFTWPSSFPNFFPIFQVLSASSKNYTYPHHHKRHIRGYLFIYIPYTGYTLCIHTTFKPCTFCTCVCLCAEKHSREGHETSA